MHSSSLLDNIGILDKLSSFSALPLRQLEITASLQWICLTAHQLESGCDLQLCYPMYYITDVVYPIELRCIRRADDEVVLSLRWRRCSGLCTLAACVLFNSQPCEPRPVIQQDDIGVCSSASATRKLVSQKEIGLDHCRCTAQPYAAVNISNPRHFVISECQ